MVLVVSKNSAQFSLNLAVPSKELTIDYDICFITVLLLRLGGMTDPETVRDAIIDLTPEACAEINEFSEKTFKTRGTRTESGMGQLIESLWGYWINKLLRENAGLGEFELAWLSHQYNDFACIKTDSDWEAHSRTGEILRIEAKSMFMDADESKGHFPEIVQNLNDNDLLLVLLWEWRSVDKYRSSPKLSDWYIGKALPIAHFRDRLHRARGGTFVDKNDCPDGCVPSQCDHHGEPLNASGNRERLDGPESRKPSGTTHGNNFGGLLRMLKTSGKDARNAFRKGRAVNDIAHQYISFIYENFPEEEESQYLKSEWKTAADEMGVRLSDQSNKPEIVDKVRSHFSGHHDVMRNLFDPTNGSKQKTLGSGQDTG